MEEMKNQLDWMKQSMSSNTQKTELLLENTKRLKELFQRVDQIEVLCCVAALSARDTVLISCTVQAFVNLVSKNVDVLEESVTNAEKTLDPSALQKMFKVLPGLVCSNLHVMYLSIAFVSGRAAKQPTLPRTGHAQRYSQRQNISIQRLLATLTWTMFISEAFYCTFIVCVCLCVCVVCSMGAVYK